MYRPHPSASSGSVDGTETRSMNPCLQSGWTGSHARTRNHYTRLGGSHLNHKSNDASNSHGCWTALEPLAPQQHLGWAFTLDATPSSYDARSQMWVFGLCVHTMSLGQLKRLGAIAGVPPGEQTKARALIAGLVALARHTSQSHCAIDYSLGSLAPTQKQNPIPRHPGGHYLPRVTVLYISRNTRTPDTWKRAPTPTKAKRLSFNSLGAGKDSTGPEADGLARHPGSGP